eukprot:INCI17811.1.p2 GENE.INCI17811.1~~INCI17811.1.p2  ORF type:complete len:195 (-),score=31.56 INCI17811.1:494-1078(-)
MLQSKLPEVCEIPIGTLEQLRPRSDSLCRYRNAGTMSKVFVVNNLETPIQINNCGSRHGWFFVVASDAAKKTLSQIERDTAVAWIHTEHGGSTKGSEGFIALTIQENTIFLYFSARLFASNKAGIAIVEAGVNTALAPKEIRAGLTAVHEGTAGAKTFSQPSTNSRFEVKASFSNDNFGEFLFTIGPASDPHKE